MKFTLRKSAGFLTLAAVLTLSSFSSATQAQASELSIGDILAVLSYAVDRVESNREVPPPPPPPPAYRVQRHRNFRPAPPAPPLVRRPVPPRPRKEFSPAPNEKFRAKRPLPPKTQKPKPRG